MDFHMSCRAGAAVLRTAGAGLLALLLDGASISSKAADMPGKAPPPASLAASDWSGFYAGGHIGYAWGSSDWLTPGNVGALNLSQPPDAFAETGSFFEGFHAGYNVVLPNRFVVGAEADTTFPAFRSAAARPSFRPWPARSRLTARRCWPPAPCAAASATR